MVLVSLNKDIGEEVLEEWIRDNIERHPPFNGPLNCKIVFKKATHFNSPFAQGLPVNYIRSNSPNASNGLSLIERVVHLEKRLNELDANKRKKSV
ncbi:1056_t:CDS:2 [Dentiscutata erythropus]|uniref:1056_t:CDS:1 n=1 Tax=Dentiscutata erythropus TaxID=1348616 RepID=A0A9N9ILX1_9GLOM|nr:1056_t:CDS:2 [Dentiscutata erythropus]